MILGRVGFSTINSGCSIGMGSCVVSNLTIEDDISVFGSQSLQQKVPNAKQVSKIL